VNENSNYIMINLLNGNTLRRLLTDVMMNWN